MSVPSRLQSRGVRIGASIVLTLGLAVYVSCYIVLRNRGLREAEEYGLGVPGIFFDSCANLERSHDLSTHHFRASLFAPLNFLDRKSFGGKGPIQCTLWDLC